VKDFCQFKSEGGGVWEHWGAQDWEKGVMASCETVNPNEGKKRGVGYTVGAAADAVGTKTRQVGTGGTWHFVEKTCETQGAEPQRTPAKYRIVSGGIQGMDNTTVRKGEKGIQEKRFGRTWKVWKYSSVGGGLETGGFGKTRTGIRDVETRFFEKVKDYKKQGETEPMNSDQGVNEWLNIQEAHGKRGRPQKAG